MEKIETEVMLAKNQISMDFDAISSNQNEEEKSIILPQNFIKSVNFDWIKNEVLFVVVKTHNNDLSSNFSDMNICGKKMIDWVLMAGSDCETMIIEDKQDIVASLLELNISKPIVAVLYSDTPLVDKMLFNQICHYFSSNKMNILKLSRGYIIRTNYLSSIGDIDSISNIYNDSKLIVCDNSKAFNYVSNIINKKIINFHLNNGVTILGENTVFIDADVEIESGVIIYPHNSLKGQTIIFSGAVIGEGNIVNNSIISSQSVIKSSYIENSKIGQGKHIEPFSKIVNEEI